MNKIKYLLIVFSLFIFSCESEDYELGNIIPPENLVISADIIGEDSENPYGDGSGQVNFTAFADRGITYDFIVNGSNYIRPSGEFEMYFSGVGLNTYTVEVRAYGVAGTMITESISVDVFVAYNIPDELINAVTTGQWRVKSEESSYIGVGPYAGTGSDSPIWFDASPGQHNGTGMFDDRYVFLTDGTFNFIANGTVFGNAEALSNDFTGSQGITPNQWGEFDHYPIEDFTENWYFTVIDEVYYLNLTGNAFLGNYNGGSHIYEILNWNSNTIYLRNENENAGERWYVKITNQP